MKEKAAVVFLVLSCLIYSQDKKYFDSPFGGGGGYTPGWVFVNLDELNKQLMGFESGKLSTSGFYTSGGAGFIYIGFVPGLRIGGMGFGGSTSSSAFVDGFDREVVYSLSGGAFTIEYTLPFIKDLAVSVGSAFGGGSIQIELFRNSGSFDWQNLWQNFNDPLTASSNLSRTFSNTFFLISPILNVDIPFYRFVSFRIGTGYRIALGKTWKIENDKEFLNVPSKLNGNGFFIQTGIFIGFFSY